MTICIAAICDNYKGVVVATDSMLTSSYLSLEFEQPTKKMTPLSDQCVALTAGNAVAHTELFNEVQGRMNNLRSPAVPAIVNELKRCYQSIRRQEIIERVLKPRGFDSFEEFYQAHRLLIPEIVTSIHYEIDRYDYGLSIIATGLTNGRAQIYHIGDPGTSQCYDAIGFHTIGSGSPHATNSLTARSCHQDLSLPDVFIRVYEAKKMAERAPGVGRQSNFAIIHKEKTKYITNDKIELIENIYEKWIRQDSTWKTELEKAII